MPKPIPDIVDAAAKCFHLNLAELFTKYIVIYSQHRNVFTITTHHLYELNKAADPMDDWRIALDLSSSAIASLMGVLPRRPEDLTVVDELHTEPQPAQVPRSTEEVTEHASGPENL